MSDFWRDIASVIFRHAGERYLEGYDQEMTLTESRLTALEDAMTSANSDLEVLNTLYTRIDEATNDIASQLRSLKEHAETGNVSAADVAARLTPLVDRLEQMGKDSTVEPGTDPTTTTDPTNSPNPDSPVVVPAPDAPTDEPTNDPTVNPVDIPADSLPQEEAPANSASTADGGSNNDGTVSNDSANGGFSSSPTTSSNEDF